jgi:hypothetical protein
MRSRSGSIASTTASTSSPFLVVAHGLFAGQVPRQVGQVHQAVDAAGRPMNTPKSVIDLIALDLVALLEVVANSSHGFGMHCFMPSEMRRRSSSISSTMTSTSSPICTTFDGLTFLLVQSISETCTRPSMPSSISTNAP